MMPPVPLLKPREVIRAFERLGWTVARQRGSHVIMTREGHIASLSIPDHPEVARGTLRSLVARAGLTVGEFIAALER
ncbi:MAG TPA: type II toxin-antitoxin system HicA family toxin [candidate division WOR-3 bacterium]|uniref:Type II toxin-antitoxin system HicA family toxin n=1 Tax=candidate division WOR-3 bacterium TaxID=2052148 RepID=A0A7V0T5E7_UNCW3|nr:type II toxin-antitoxin system HicA family toxin [candidate division WOR-3 bacterium]